MLKEKGSCFVVLNERGCTKFIGRGYVVYLFIYFTSYFHCPSYIYVNALGNVEQLHDIGNF